MRHRIPQMRAEDRRDVAVRGLVGLDEGVGRLSEWAVRRKVVDDGKSLARKNRAVDILAAELDEFFGGDAVGLEDRPLVTAFAQRFLRQYRRRSGGRDEHR